MDYRLPKDSVMRLLNDGHRLVRCITNGKGHITVWTINGQQVHHKTVESFIKAKMLIIEDVGDKYRDHIGRYTEFSLKEALIEN